MQYLDNFLETCMVAGFHALGFNFIISFIGMLFIHSAQSYPTLEVRVLCSLIVSCFWHLEIVQIPPHSCVDENEHMLSASFRHM